MKKRFYKLRDMMYQFFEFFLYRLVENLVLGKNHKEKLRGSWDILVFPEKNFFFVFFKNHDVLKLFFDIFFFGIKNCLSQKKFWFISIIYSFIGKFLVKKLFSEKTLSEILITV